MFTRKMSRLFSSVVVLGVIMHTTLAGIMMDPPMVPAISNSIVVLQLERAASSPKFVPINWRSNASNKSSVYLKCTQTLTLGICLRTAREVTVKNVRYSNDGGSDTIALKLNNNRLGSFITKNQTNVGNSWNDFQDSGPIGNTTTLPAGTNSMQFILEATDEYGVELDAVTIELSANTNHPIVNSVTFYCDPPTSDVYPGPSDKCGAADPVTPTPGPADPATSTPGSTDPATPTPATSTPAPVDPATPTSSPADTTTDIATPSSIVICEGTTKSVTCPTNTVIQVLTANYGRTAGGDVCPHAKVANQNCRSDKSALVSQLCDGKSTCTIRPNNSNMGGDPCVGTYKYLQIEYDCMDGETGSTGGGKKNKHRRRWKVIAGRKFGHLTRPGRGGKSGRKRGHAKP